MEIIEWDGETITQGGLYSGIDLEDYHNKKDLLNGPSVSKSALKMIAPPDGNPKKFWSFWRHNPDRIVSKRSRALNFGKAAHALLLGDEVFADKFVVQPEKVEGETYHGSKTVWKNWFKDQAELGLTVITADEFDQIRRMSADASQHGFVKAGGLNGRVEVSMFYKDPETGIWLMSRPDVSPNDGMYNDLKTAAKLDDDYLENQIADAGYYLQAAMTRMICTGLGIPFDTFTFLYSLSLEYGDTDFRVLAEDDILLGEHVVRYGLHHIRRGLDTGDWPGAAINGRENKPIRMKPWARDKISSALKMEGFL